MKDLLKAEAQKKTPPKKEKFNFEQRDWDFEELERLKREELKRNLEE